MSNEFEIVDFEWAKMLENAFTFYMDAVRDSVDDEEEYETLSGDFYCGCETCDTREIMFFLVPQIIRAYKLGKVVLLNDEDL